jgi:CRP-like cAMP-binding protein
MEHKRSAGEAGDRTGDGVPTSLPTDHLGYARLRGQVELFAGLDRVTLAKLAAHLEPLSFPPNTTILHQGEPGDAFYLVARGSVGVYSGNDSSETPMKILHEGEPFGEMALLTNSTRTASIRTETDCEVLRLSRGVFLDVVREQPSVALSIAATLSRRLASMLGHQEELKEADVAVLADGGASGLVPAARPRWRLRTGYVAFGAAAVILGLGWMLPPPGGLSPVAWHALIVLLAPCLRLCSTLCSKEFWRF